MSDESAEFEAGDLLRALGKVLVPAPRALDDAREVLWSAIADEILGIGAAGERGTAAGGSAASEEEHRRMTRRRQAGLSQGERGMRMGGNGQRHDGRHDDA
jgi:hypothetical protein